MDNLIQFLAAALALMASPGPATLSSAATGAAFGTRAAVPYVIGISLGTTTVIALVATGLTGLIAAIDGVGEIAAILAACYILYLAYRIATAPPLAGPERVVSAPPLLAGYALAIANPKAYAAMAALFSGFVLIDGDPVRNAATKFSLLAALAFCINLTWMCLGTTLAGAMRKTGVSRAINTCFAALLVVSVSASVLL